MSITEMLKQDAMRSAVDHIVNKEFKSLITAPVRQDLFDRLMHVLERFKKERGFEWKEGPEFQENLK